MNNNEIYTKARLTEIQSIATERGGVCLSISYVNSFTKMKFQCSKGHQWEAVPNNIKNGQWCPDCKWDSKMEQSYLKLQEIVAAKGGTITGEYESAHTKMTFMCRDGHVWDASPNNIKKGKWCPQCHIDSIKEQSYRESQEIVAAKGGTITGEYVDTLTKIKFQCSKGHQWEAVPSSIKNIGSWCPQCHFDSIKEQSYRELQEIVAAKGGTITGEYENNSTKMTFTCSKNHTWDATPNSIKNGKWCPQCHIDSIKEQSYRELQEIVAAKGGTITGEYENSSTKMTFTCSKGHVWDATPDHIKRGQWCPQCHRDSRMKKGNDLIVLTTNQGERL